MSFSLTKQKGPAATWDGLRSERNKKRKRGSSIRKKNPVNLKIGVLVHIITEFTSKLFLTVVIGFLLLVRVSQLVRPLHFGTLNHIHKAL